MLDEGALKSGFERRIASGNMLVCKWHPFEWIASLGTGCIGNWVRSCRDSLNRIVARLLLSKVSGAGLDLRSDAARPAATTEIVARVER